MPLTLDALMDGLSDPQRLHALVVHVPIAGAVFGLLLVLVLCLTAGRSHGLRWGAVLVLGVSALASFYASKTGEDALAHQADVRRDTLGVTKFALSEEADRHLAIHEQYAGYLGWTLTAAAVFAAMSIVPRRGARSIMLTLALLTSVGGVGLVTIIGHHGGQLVYTHGVGVPGTGNNLPVVEKKTAPDVTPEPQPKTDADTDNDAGTDTEAEADMEAGTDEEAPDPREVPRDGQNIFDP